VGVTREYVTGGDAARLSGVAKLYCVQFAGFSRRSRKNDRGRGRKNDKRGVAKDSRKGVVVGGGVEV
jgi:hypothetical protein